MAHVNKTLLSTSHFESQSATDNKRLHVYAS